MLDRERVLHLLVIHQFNCPVDHGDIAQLPDAYPYSAAPAQVAARHAGTPSSHDDARAVPEERKRQQVGAASGAGRGARPSGLSGSRALGSSSRALQWRTPAFA